MLGWPHITSARAFKESMKRTIDLKGWKALYVHALELDRALKSPTFEWLYLCVSIRSAGEVANKNKTGGRHRRVTWKKKQSETKLRPSVRSFELWFPNRPENMRLSFSSTSTLSSHTSERITNMASSFSSSSCLSLAEAFTEVEDGPPKKFMLP